MNILQLRIPSILSAFLLVCSSVFAQDVEEKQTDDVRPMPMEELLDVAQQLAGISAEQFLELVNDARQSIVVVETFGRDGQRLTTGSGFIVSEDGLIATNLHVIGEARPIKVRLLDQREFAVTEILGTNKKQDVAVIRIDERKLKPLPIEAMATLSHGQPIFALGNPQGLEHSVVTGVVSGFRDNDDGMSLIQLAIPIEAGNSGGPLLDMQGQVHGLLTLKSQVTENLGYAVKATAVRELLDSPNPIPMSTWMTIGALNQKLWDPRGDVHWRHRAGMISVSGTGRGFGGRALCLSKQTAPEMPYELAVDVKIDEEDGAAGLVFHSDGEDVHYGFYPSSGSLRLSRFDGPTVYSWNVLQTVPSSAFRPDDWNRLKVRVTEESLQCFCNDELVIEHANPRLTGGRVGIAKFRHTTAHFKRFRFADEIPSEKPSDELLARIEQISTEIDYRRPPTAQILDGVSDFDTVGQNALQEQARILEQKAAQLKVLAREIHEQKTREEIVETLQAKEGEQVNLLRAALLISKMDNPELNVAAYEEQVDQLAEEYLGSLFEASDDRIKVDQLNQFLFVKNAFHGSRTNYYHASNSYLNEVIDDREGLPLTLSILYVELARRAGLNADGIGLPGHFIARVIPSQVDADSGEITPGEPIYIDTFESGELLTPEDCKERVRNFSGLPWDDRYLYPQPTHAIVQRMLRNLIRVANNDEDLESALRYVRTILELDPASIEDRLYKSVICYHTNRLDEALQEVNHVLEEAPVGIDLRKVDELRESIEAKLQTL